MTSSRPGLVVGVLASCGLSVSIMQTLVVPLLPRFPQLLGASPTTVAWLVTANLVAGAVCAPMLGRLGDLHGKRRMLLVALAMIVAGSVLGALAPDAGTLIAARVLQGGALGVVPLGISLMRDAIPPDRVGGGIALMSSSLGIGGAIGLPVTGLVAEHASWRWLFAGAAVLGLVQLIAVRRLVAEPATRAAGRFDVPGAILLGLALVAFLLPVTKGNAWGWGSPGVLGLGAASVALFAVWGRLELRRPSPLVDLRVSARPAVLLTNIASILVGFAMFASFLVTTQLLQAPLGTGYGFGLELLPAALVLLPNGAAMVVFSNVSARVSARFGARTTLVAGTLVILAGNAGLATLPGSIPGIIAVSLVVSVGTALAYSALPLLIMDAVPATETAAANSLNTLMRMIGTSSCSAAVAAVSTGLVVAVDGHLFASADAYVVIYGAAAVAALGATVIAALTPRARPVPVAVPATAGG